MHKWAKAFLILDIIKEVCKTMEKTKSTAKMWKMFKDNLDLKTTFTIHKLIGTQMTLRYRLEVRLKAHLNDFAAQWSTMLDKTVPLSGVKDGLGYHLHQITKDIKCIAAFLLLSVRHSSIENVVNKLQTKEDLTYELAHYKLLAIAQCHSNNQETRVLTANRTPPTSKNMKICMYYKERNMRLERHLAKECWKKKKARKLEH